MNGSLPEIKFWDDVEAELVNTELFSDVANKWAEAVKKDGRDKSNKISQIRKFYDEVLFYHGRVKNEEEFKKMLPYLKILNAKAFYAEGRGHVTELFKKFIMDSISQVKTKKDLDVFVKFFEAFMGFYRYYDEMESKKKGGGK